MTGRAARDRCNIIFLPRPPILVVWIFTARMVRRKYSAQRSPSQAANVLITLITLTPFACKYTAFPLNLRSRLWCLWRWVLLSLKLLIFCEGVFPVVKFKDIVEKGILFTW